MDQVAAQALTLYARLCNLSRSEAVDLTYEQPARTVALPISMKPKRPKALTGRRRPVLVEP